MRRLVGFALPNSVRSVCSIKARVRCAPTMRNASDASAAAIHETVLECTRASLREPLLDAQRVMGGIALSALPAHYPVTCFYYRCAQPWLVANRSPSITHRLPPAL